jgi:TonB family protein
VILAAFSLFLGCVWAAKPQEEESLRFKPVQVVSVVEPTYPANSIAKGTVILQVTVSGSGKIDEVTVIHQVPSLTEEAERTVRKWKFQPAQLNGTPVTSTMIAAFYFGHPLISGQ